MTSNISFVNIANNIANIIGNADQGYSIYSTDEYVPIWRYHIWTKKIYMFSSEYRMPINEWEYINQWLIMQDYSNALELLQSCAEPWI